MRTKKTTLRDFVSEGFVLIGWTTYPPVVRYALHGLENALWTIQMGLDGNNVAVLWALEAIDDTVEVG